MPLRLSLRVAEIYFFRIGRLGLQWGSNPKRQDSFLPDPDFVSSSDKSFNNTDNLCHHQLITFRSCHRSESSENPIAIMADTEYVRLVDRSACAIVSR